MKRVFQEGAVCAALLGKGSRLRQGLKEGRHGGHLVQWPGIWLRPVRICCLLETEAAGNRRKSPALLPSQRTKIYGLGSAGAVSCKNLLSDGLIKELPLFFPTTSLFVRMHKIKRKNSGKKEKINVAIQRYLWYYN